MRALGSALLVCLLPCAVDATQTPYPPFFTPCNFPTPSNHLMFRAFCTGSSRRFEFICDLHQQISPVGLPKIEGAFNKYKSLFRTNSSYSLGIVLVRQLSPPSSVEAMFRDKDGYRCLLEHECFRMDREKATKFVSNPKVYTKIYAMALYKSWFLREEECQPNIMALIVIDGLLNDARKFTFVNLYTSEIALQPSLMNVQLETANAILQGWPLHEVIADLIDQLGYTLREYRQMGGVPRAHGVPRWALKAFAACACLIGLALFIEWYIVRRKLAVKRSPSGIKLHAARSKTHIMF